MLFGYTYHFKDWYNPIESSITKCFPPPSSCRWYTVTETFLYVETHSIDLIIILDYAVMNIINNRQRLARMGMKWYNFLCRHIQSRESIYYAFFYKNGVSSGVLPLQDVYLDRSIILTFYHWWQNYKNRFTTILLRVRDTGFNVNRSWC